MLSIWSYLRTGDYLIAIIVILSRCFIVFCCTPIHEFAHAYVAYKLGDNTAQYKGRLTINPLAHLDPIGTLMIFLFGIGYAKPVPVNPLKFKKQKLGMVLTSLAGPVSNILMGFASVFMYYLLARFLPTDSALSIAVINFFYFSASINVTLAVFNFFPIPPLDGSKILLAILPDDKYFKYMAYERYIMLALLGLLFFGVLDTPIFWLSDKLMKLISIIPSLIF